MRCVRCGGPGGRLLVRTGLAGRDLELTVGRGWACGGLQAEDGTRLLSSRGLEERVWKSEVGVGVERGLEVLEVVREERIEVRGGVLGVVQGEQSATTLKRLSARH